MLEQLARAGLVQGKTMGVDSTTLEANAAMRSIVRRETGENYPEFLKRVGPQRTGKQLRTRRRCGAWIASGRKRPATKIGRALPIRKRKSPSSKTVERDSPGNWSKQWIWRPEPSLQ